MKALTYDPFAKFDKVELINGLKLMVNHVPDLPYEYVGFMIHAGAKDDPKGSEGLAHFVEHLVSKNIPGIGYKESKEFFHLMGGQFNSGESRYNSTIFHFQSSIEKIEESLQIMNRMLIGSKLENFIERERGIITNEFHRSFPSKFSLEIAKSFPDFLYDEGSPLKRFISPLGHLESIQKISQADAQGFYDNFYIPQNMSIVAVGGLDFTEVFKALSKTGWMTEIPQKASLFLPQPARERKSHRIGRKIVPALESLKDSKEMGTDFFEARTIIPKGLTNKYAIRAFRKLLQEELEDRLRQKQGKVYSVKLTTWDNLEYFEFALSTRLPSGNLEKMEAEIFPALKKICGDGERFEIDKKKTLASLAMLDYCVQDLMYDALKDIREDGRIISLEETYSGRQSATLDDVKNIADLFRNSPIFFSALDSSR